MGVFIIIFLRGDKDSLLSGPLLALLFRQILDLLTHVYICQNQETFLVSVIFDRMQPIAWPISSFRFISVYVLIVACHVQMYLSEILYITVH